MVHQFCRSLDIIPDRRYQLTHKTILKGVLDGSIFGMVQCSLMTPPNLKAKFADYPPIAKHVKISRDDVGEISRFASLPRRKCWLEKSRQQTICTDAVGAWMASFAEKHDLLKKPTSSLITSYFADEILLATPLLKWYLQHGLEVTSIQQVIQYKPRRCFKAFTEEIVTARREAGQDVTLSSMSKLMGELFFAFLEFEKSPVPPPLYPPCSFQATRRTAKLC